MNLASGTQSAMLANIILFTSRLLLAWIFVHEGAFLATNLDPSSTVRFTKILSIHGNLPRRGALALHF